MRFKPVLHIIFTFLIAIGSFASKYDTDSLQQVLHLTDLPSEKVKILNLLAHTFSKDDPTKAKNFAKQAIFIAESINDEEGKAEAQYYIAQALIINRDNAGAFDLLSESLLIFETNKNEKWIAKVSLLLASEYKRRYEFEQALRLLYNALTLFKERENEIMLASTYTIIGGVYFDQGNTEKAFENYQNALSIFIKINNKKGASYTYNNIGEIYRLEGQSKDALLYYNKAIDYNEDPGRKEFLAVVYQNMGIVHLNQNKYDSAYYFLTLSENLSRQIDIPERNASINISLGKYHLKQGNLEKSLNYFLTGYETSLLYSNLLSIKDAALGLSDVFAQQKNFRKAYYYHNEYKVVSDSILKISNLGKIAQIEMKNLYDNEQKIREMERQKTSLKYVTLAICLSFVLILLILLYGRQRIKLKHSHIVAENMQLEHISLKDEIDFKNRELTTNVMYLVNKNELLNLITEKLQKSKSKFSPENRKKVESIILNLQQNLDKDIWKEFESRFREVHKDFYEKLVEKFPHLTEKDKKLCALIKLNLSTKEISTLSHLNINSVEVARTRLRKKLNISKTDIGLNKFLSGI
ncbi:MAG: tetratricopeptide repeat protein [Bacteroidales bacterium]